MARSTGAGIKTERVFPHNSFYRLVSWFRRTGNRHGNKIRNNLRAALLTKLKITLVAGFTLLSQGVITPCDSAVQWHAAGRSFWGIVGGASFLFCWVCSPDSLGLQKYP